MHNSLITEEKDQKSRRRFSILAPDTQAQYVCYSNTFTPDSKPEATEQGRTILIGTIIKATLASYSFLK